MSWFFKPTDTEIFKDALQHAIDEHDTNTITHLLKNMGDLPKKLLKFPLETAIRNNDVPLTFMLLEHGALPSEVDKDVMRDVVQQNKADIYRLLTATGVDFLAYDYETSQYQYRLTSLRHQIEIDDLKKALQEMKAEITELKKEKSEARILKCHVPKL